MSSLSRRIQRKYQRSLPDYEPAPQPFRMLADGGYETLHPTRGWKRFSGKRLRAQRRMAHILGA